MNTLKDLRVQAGKTAAEVAEKLGISRSTYSNYEQGTRTIPLNLVIPLGKILDVSTEEIIEAQLSSINIRSSN